MNVYNILDLALKHDGEYVLGSADLHTHACYVIYGILKSGEKGRLIKPGKGHEEIVCLIEGEALFRTDSESFALKKGEAFHIAGENALLMENNGKEDAVYVIAGGHGGGPLH